MGVEVAGARVVGLVRGEALGVEAGEDLGMAAAGGDGVGPGVDQRPLNQGEMRYPLLGQAPLDQAVGLVQLVGPLGHGGGREEQIGEQSGVLGHREQAPDPPHRVLGRHPAGGRLVADQQ